MVSWYRHQQERPSTKLPTGPLAEEFTVDSVGVVRLASASLDREERSQILLTVAAFDMGPDQGRRSASTLVNITVEDINDHPPVFSRAVYSASIVEDIPLSPPSPILQVLASDADAGENAAVRYSLGPEPAAAWFRLDPDSGFLYPAQRVTADQSEVVLTVLATDGKFNDTATVKVGVLAANHDKPRFIKPATDNKIYYVEENVQEAGSLVLTAEASDRDQGDNGRLSYYFRVGETDGSETDEFAIDSETGEVRTRVRFDRESRDKYTLVLVARDHGSPIPHESARSVQIHVLDVDDHVPQFREHVHRFSLMENSRPGTAVGSVRAEDPDSAETGRTFYFLVGGDAAAFSVSQRGDIAVTRSLDREQRDQYEIIVKATSNASFYAENVTADDLDPTLTVIKITVLDLNDSPPAFEAKEYFAGVSELAQFRDPVTTVAAFDPDQGQNGELVYTIRSTQLYKPGSAVASGAIVPSPFSIDSGGRLTCATLMGEYKHHRFLVQLAARERYAPRREALARVHVWVYDASQLVHVTLGVPPDAIVRQPDRIVKAFSNATGGRVVIDDVRYHVTEENVVKRTWSDMYMHVADAEQQIVPTADVLRAFDQHYDYLQRQHAQLRLQKVQAADARPVVQETSQTLVTLVALLLVLVIGLVTMCAVCCCLKNVPATIPVDMEQVKRPQPASARQAAEPEGPAGTENPLWIGNKLKMYEEQELSMQVVSDPEPRPSADDRALADELQSNTYATLQRPDSRQDGVEHSPSGDTGDYATLGRYSAAPALPPGPTIPGVVPAPLSERTVVHRDR
ncbi:cadherin-87A-like [Pollicipes pollicipes]|uniref:cadherin-87A-like n=1 Tax=Pollicipes pollicipes TaxID=41117 RepID=UPI001884A154|nr:cadherin-87A-like [Pollicipes pollicipes]